MFGRRARVAAPPQTPPGNLGYHTEVALVGNPDVVNIDRQRALYYRVGLGLQGLAGTVIGYDRGDPAHSLTAVINNPERTPTNAYAAIGRPADALTMAPTPEFSDMASTNPQLDPYNALLWNRIAR